MSDDPLRYGILGDDGLTEEERLTKYTGPVSRDYLLPHLKAGVLFRVDQTVDLNAAAIAVMRDDKAQVQAWLDEQLFTPATEADLCRGEGDVYSAVVVSPFVLFC